MSVSRQFAAGAIMAAGLGLMLALVSAVSLSARPEAAQAQTGTSCPNGTFIPGGGTCSSIVTVCPDGSSIAGGGTCGQSQPACPNGGASTTGSGCTASAPIGCPGGGVIVAGQACPSPTTGQSTCPDGTVVFTGQACPVQTTVACPGGGIVFTGQSCPLSLSFTCPSGQVVFAGTVCPAQTTTMPLPAGQWVLIQNTTNLTATVSGADVVDVWNPFLQSYQQTTLVPPGQSAWALSFTGGVATITYA